MQFVQRETSACKTSYSVGGIPGYEPCEVILWAITGGQLAMDFVEYGFDKRFHVCEKFTHDKEVCGPKSNVHPNGAFQRYAHQAPNALQGPQIGVDLPQAEAEAWLKVALTARALYRVREAEIEAIIGHDNPKSRRFHMKDDGNHGYFWCKADAWTWGRIRLTPVTMESSYAFGRIDANDEEWKYMDDFWRNATLTLAALWDKSQAAYNFRLDQMTQEDFAAYVAFFKSYVETYLPTKRGHK